MDFFLNSFKQGGNELKIFSQSFQQLEQALSTATLKQRVISANIANVDTPNYKSKSVEFQTALTDALNHKSISSYRTNTKHLQFSSENLQGNPRIKVNNETMFQPNGNNVDMDYEMAQLAKNQLWFNAVTDRVNGNLSSLRTVINDGR